MKLRKAEARLERRIAAYDVTLKKVGPDRARGFTRPGSPNKCAPKGRGLR